MMVDGAVKSANRVLMLLERLGEARGEMSHADLAEALDIPKSSLSQLLKTLIGRRWLTYSAQAKTYALGPAVVALAARAQRADRLAALAPPILGRLTAATGETSALNLRKDDESVVVATALSPQRLLSVMREGDRAPLYATSGGKAMLAGWPDLALTAYLNRTRFQAFTSHTVASASRLRSELDLVRQGGAAVSLEEFTAGVIGVALGVVDDLGETSASVNIAMPAIRGGLERRVAAANHIRRAVTEFEAGLARTGVGQDP